MAKPDSNRDSDVRDSNAEAIIFSLLIGVRDGERVERDVLKALKGLGEIGRFEFKDILRCSR